MVYISSHYLIQAVECGHTMALYKFKISIDTYVGNGFLDSMNCTNGLASKKFLYVYGISSDCYYLSPSPSLSFETFSMF